MKIHTVSSLLIFLAILFCNVQAIAQESTPPVDEFPIGVFSNESLFTDPNAFPVLEELGVNYVVEEARSSTQVNSQLFNLIASNANYPTDVIYHYSNAIYKRWDAERNNNNNDITGFKHAMGTVETYNGAVCWTTANLSEPVEELLDGPNYQQDKKYKLNYQPYYQQKITFKVRFRIAFEDNGQLPSNTEVCSLYVMYGVNVIVNNWYSDEYIYIPLVDENGKKTLTVEDFPTDDFYIFELTYSYPDTLLPPLYYKNGDGMIFPSSQQYADDISKTGIEFRLDWRGVGKLYIDYAEVFDMNINSLGIIGIGEKLISNEGDVKEEIADYLANYNTPGWDNIKYWFAADEPQTLDQYTPMRIVDSLLLHHPNIVNKKPIITEFMPQWNGWRNGDKTMLKFIELANPEKLMMDYFPFWLIHTNEYGLDLLRERLQEADSAQGDFWYVPQSFGQIDVATGNPVFWRKPNTTEMKASVFLALAHGAKDYCFGIMKNSFLRY